MSIENTESKKLWKSQEFRKYEEQLQNLWEKQNSHIIRISPKNNGTDPDKFFATFPYPYMNGFLHLGHGFTMSKYDFISRYYRMCGRNVLQPFSFHLTGMPIVAASDKLKEDLKFIKSFPENIHKLQDYAKNGNS